MNLAVSFAATGLNPQPRQAHALTAIKAINSHEKEFFTGHPNAIPAVGTIEGALYGVAALALIRKRIRSPNLEIAGIFVIAFGMAAVAIDTLHGAIPPSPNGASADHYLLSALGGAVATGAISPFFPKFRRQPAVPNHS